MNWDTPVHHPKQRYCDVPKIGRYLVRRERKGSRWWIVLLNGKKTSYGGDTMDQAMKAVERVVTAQGIK